MPLFPVFSPHDFTKLAPRCSWLLLLLQICKLLCLPLCLLFRFSFFDSWIANRTQLCTCASIAIISWILKSSWNVFFLPYSIYLFSLSYLVEINWLHLGFFFIKKLSVLRQNNKLGFVSSENCCIVIYFNFSVRVEIFFSSNLCSRKSMDTH